MVAKNLFRLILVLVVGFCIYRCTSSDGTDSSSSNSSSSTDSDDVEGYVAAVFVEQPADTIYFTTSGSSSNNTFKVRNLYEDSSSGVTGVLEFDNEYSTIFTVGNVDTDDDGVTTMSLSFAAFDSAAFTQDTTTLAGVQIEIVSPSEVVNTNGPSALSDDFVVAVVVDSSASSTDD